ncbi:DUF1554 domain-containing protein [Leptospira sp. 96542]|nr:DUF1554 domain-containing protein [Leptospira sp. 96542]
MKVTKVECLMRHRLFFLLCFPIFFSFCQNLNTRDEYLLTLLNGLGISNVRTLVTVGRLQVTENPLTLRYGTPTIFQIRLSAQPAQDVAVTVQFDNTKMTVNGGTTSVILFFTPTNFNTLQSVTINSTATIIDSSEINLSSISNDAAYNNDSAIIPVTHWNIAVTYTGNSFLFRENEAINTLNPTIGFPYTNCSVSPTLPAGLSLDPSTCIISGTPTNQQLSSVYTISASNASDTANQPIGIQIDPEAYRIFVTNSSFSGDLRDGGTAIQGADAKCNADANKPSTGTYSALIVDGVDRLICATNPNCSPGDGADHTGRVLKNNKLYIRASDNAFLFETNASGVFTIANDSTNYLAHSFATGSTRYYWTGFALSAYWQQAFSPMIPSYKCDGWTSQAPTTPAANGGRVGSSSSRTYAAFRSGDGISCASLAHLLCVEQ